MFTPRRLLLPPADGSVCVTLRRTHLPAASRGLGTSVVFSLSSAVVLTIASTQLNTAHAQGHPKGFSGPVRCAAFSPDGKMLAFGPSDWTVRLWDVAAGTLRATLKGHTGYVCTMAFSPDGNILATTPSCKRSRCVPST